MSYIFVVPGTESQISVIAEREGINKDDLIHLVDINQLDGVSDPIVWAVGTYFMNDVSRDIIARCINERSIPVIVKDLVVKR